MVSSQANGGRLANEGVSWSVSSPRVCGYHYRRVPIDYSVTLLVREGIRMRRTEEKTMTCPVNWHFPEDGIRINGKSAIKKRPHWDFL